MRRVACSVCASEFEARLSTAKYCSDRCRSRARVARSQPRPKGLLATVEAELKAAGRLNSSGGQLALELARLITSPGTTGLATLSKELRAVLALELAEARRSAAVDPAETQDEVALAREARERKARQAARGA